MLAYLILALCLTGVIGHSTKEQDDRKCQEKLQDSGASSTEDVPSDPCKLSCQDRNGVQRWVDLNNGEECRGAQIGNCNQRRCECQYRELWETCTRAYSGVTGFDRLGEKDCYIRCHIGSERRTLARPERSCCYNWGWKDWGRCSRDQYCVWTQQRDCPQCSEYDYDP